MLARSAHERHPILGQEQKRVAWRVPAAVAQQLGGAPRSAQHQPLGEQHLRQGWLDAGEHGHKLAQVANLGLDLGAPARVLLARQGRLALAQVLRVLAGLLAQLGRALGDQLARRLGRDDHRAAEHLVAGQYGQRESGC